MSKDRSLQQLYWAIILTVSSLLFGTCGFLMIENYNWYEAFYMAVITISTVGFNEVRPLSEAGRIFTSIFIIFNIGIFAFVVAVTTSYLFEGRLKKIFNYYMTGREVKKLKDHIIVCGYGRNGAKVCEELIDSAQHFVIIENDEDILGTIPDNKYAHLIVGDATTDEVLTEAGVKNATFVITTLPRDAENVYISLTARELNPDIKIISRSTDNSSTKKLYRAGVHKVVMPDTLGGLHMARLVTKPDVVEFLDLLTGVGTDRLMLEEITYEQLKPQYKDKSIRELDIRKISGVTVLAYRDLEKKFEFNPPPDRQISKDGILIVLGNVTSMEKFKNHFGGLVL